MPPGTPSSRPWRPRTRQGSLCGGCVPCISSAPLTCSTTPAAERLAQARRIADELGAASTGAVIDLQLTAVAMFRFELGEAERHAQSALAISTRLGLAKTHAIGLLFLGRDTSVAPRPRGHGSLSRARPCRRTRRPGNRRQRASRRARDAGAARRRPSGRSGGPRPRRRHPRHAAPARPGPLSCDVAAAAGRDRRRGRGGGDRQRPADRPDRSTGSTGESSATPTRSSPAEPGTSTRPPNWPSPRTGSCGTTRSGPTWPGSAPPSQRWQTAGASRANGWRQRPARSPGTGSSRWRCGAAGCWNSRHRAAGPG